MGTHFDFPKLGRAVAAAVVACIALAPAAASAQSELEYAVKAAYLLRFGLYVEWPPVAFGSATSPFLICVVGEDPFGDVLDTAVKDQRIGERPIVVRRLKTISRDSGCHVAYFGGADATRQAQSIEAVRGSHVLTFSDAPLGAGGAAAIVRFVVRDNRVRFEIDDAAAAQNGLIISSKLLSLALRVKPRSS